MNTGTYPIRNDYRFPKTSHTSYEKHTYPD